MIVRFGFLSVVFLFLAIKPDTMTNTEQATLDFRLVALLLGLLHAVAAYMLMFKRRGAVIVARIAGLLPPSLWFSWYFFVSKRVKYTYSSKPKLQLAREELGRHKGWQQ